MEPKEKTKPKYNMFQNTWFMIKVAWQMKEKKVIVLCVLLAVIFVANNLLNLYFAPMVLSIIENHGTVKQMLQTVVFFTLAIMISNGAQSYVACNTLFGRVSVRFKILSMINQKVACTSYCNLFDEKFINMSMKARETTYGDGSATQVIWNSMSTILLNLLGFITYISMLSYMNPVLLGIVLVTTIVGYFINRYFSSYYYRHKEESNECHSRLYYAGMEAPRNTAIKDIRIFGFRSWLEEMYQKSMKDFIVYETKEATAWFLGSKTSDVLLSFVRNGAAYIYLIGMVLQGSISATEFLLYFSVVNEFSNWVNGIFYHVNDLYKYALEISIVREVLEYPESYQFEGGKALQADKTKRYELELENVSYRYPGADKDVLTNINLKIRPGENIAIVGLNGAGKTTLVKVICGFLDPTEGRVLLNGVDIREYNRSNYYELFSAVFQDFAILPHTIAVNVAQELEVTDEEKMKSCIEKAGLKEKIERLPEQYQTLLRKEVYKEALALSGGETQRLMLARALYKDAPFIILDEPTAALDPIAESEIYQRYNEMTTNKSSLYISHRLASTRFCDRVLLIDGSVIREEGTHEALIQLGGKYAKLFEVQSKYYREGGEADEEDTKVDICI